MADVAAAQGGEQAAGAPTMGDRAMYFGRQLMMYYLVSTAFSVPTGESGDPMN